MRTCLALRHALFATLALSNFCVAEKMSLTAAQSGAANNNALAFDLYAQARAAAADSENFAFSPVSISSALTMTLDGARASTAIQMRSVLHLPLEKTDALANTGALLKIIQTSAAATGVNFKIANRLFGARG